MSSYRAHMQEGISLQNIPSTPARKASLNSNGKYPVSSLPNMSKISSSLRLASSEGIEPERRLSKANNFRSCLKINNLTVDIRSAGESRAILAVLAGFSFFPHFPESDCTVVINVDNFKSSGKSKPCGDCTGNSAYIVAVDSMPKPLPFSYLGMVVVLRLLFCPREVIVILYAVHDISASNRIADCNRWRKEERQKRVTRAEKNQ